MTRGLARRMGWAWIAGILCLSGVLGDSLEEAIDRCASCRTPEEAMVQAGRAVDIASGEGRLGALRERAEGRLGGEGDPGLNVLLGRIAESVEDPQQSADCYAAALKGFDHPGVRKDCLKALGRMDRQEELLALCRESDRLYPADSWWLQTGMDALLDMGQDEEARTWARQIQARWPNAPEALSSAAEALAKASRPEEALALFESMMRRWPAGAYGLTRARLLRDMGRFDEALDAYRALGKDGLGEALRVQAAEEEIALSLSLRRASATLSAERSRIEALRIALLAQLQSRADALETSGDYALDAEVLGKALALSPEDSQLRYRLAKSLARAGWVHEAISEAEGILRWTEDAALIEEVQAFIERTAADVESAPSTEPSAPSAPTTSRGSDPKG